MSEPSDPTVRSGEEGMPHGSVLRRRRVLLLLAGIAVGVAVGALVSAQLVRSPAQRVADTAPPPPTVLTAEVDQRVLVDTVVLRGQVGASRTAEIEPAPGETGRAVVTAIRVGPGDKIESGTSLVEVSGRPVIALQGEVPAYRDLRPGASGTDVMQMQQALADLGLAVGDVDGRFGAATKAAVASLYDELGYEARTAGDEGTLAAAEDAVRQAERVLVQAQDALEDARGSRPRPSPAPGQQDPVQEAERQVEFAREDLETARQRRREVEEATGPMLPLSEVVFLPEFPARVERVNAEVGLDVTSAPQEGGLLTVSSGELVVSSHLNTGQRELLAEGMSADLVSELTGVTATGEIVSIGEARVDQEIGSRGHEMIVAPADGRLDEQLAGANVRVTVEAASTDEEVLVVPVSAVFTGADAQVMVSRLNPDGSQERVHVSPGVSGDGYVAVTPLDGRLAEGDQVVVGEGTNA